MYFSGRQRLPQRAEGRGPHYDEIILYVMFALVRLGFRGKNLLLNYVYKTRAGGVLLGVIVRGSVRSMFVSETVAMASHACWA